MTEEQPKPAEETPVEERPKPAEETPAEEQPKPAEETPTTSQLVADLQKKFTESYDTLKSKYENEIIQRDDIIKQLMTGTPQSDKISVADKINQKRNFKKW